MRGHNRPTKRRFAVVKARFNDAITEALLRGCRRAFEEAGVASDDVLVCEVPGCFELPVAASWLADSKRYDAVVCLGCVIRGETPHFEYVAGAAAFGIASAALRTGVPIVFGVLTTNTLEQARARSAPVRRASRSHSSADGWRPVSAGTAASRKQPASNKGYEAALTALAMAGLRERLS